MGRSTTPNQRALFAAFLLALLPAGTALKPKLDEDTWWHLATGRYVVDHRAVPDTDPFSRFGQEEHVPWVAYSWLHEVALYAVYSAGDVGGVLAFRHVLGSLSFLTVAWFVLRGSCDRCRSLVVLALVTGTLVPMMLERPWHYTVVFSTLTLHATIELRAGAPPRRFWWLIPVYALWANLHIQFVLGLGVAGLGLLATAVEQFRAGGETRRWGAWAGLIAGCGLATLINPYHARLYAVVWEYATQSGALRIVYELAPPDFHRWWNWPLALLLLWAAGACIARRLPVFDTALLVAGAAFSLRMQRDVWFGALAAAAVLTRLSPAVAMETEPRLMLRLAGITLAAVALARLGWALGPGQDRPATDVNRREYPAAAAEFVRAHRLPGPLYNHFDWGGHLIWALPDYPVGLDGRTNVYGDERLLRADRTWAGQDGWEHDPDLSAAGVIIAPKQLNGNEVRLTALLRAAPDRWRIAYEDHRAVVFVGAD
jgi:hypothetical protein